MNQGTDDLYKIRYKGKIKWIINKELAQKQKLSPEAIRLIGNLYIVKDKIEARMKRAYNHYQRVLNEPTWPPSTKDYFMNKFSNQLRHEYSQWEDNEFMLQALWKFDLNRNFHKSYKLPGCTCPKMDNDDSYPIIRVVNSQCLLHTK